MQLMHWQLSELYFLIGNVFSYDDAAYCPIVCTLLV